jgi:2-dehydro-3-deoxygalactonokinase
VRCVSTPALIALDWGTTSLRAYLLDESGQVCDHQASPLGITRLATGGFSATLDGVIGRWRAAHPGLTIVASGMVGSRAGWVEAPYLPCPVSLESLAASLVDVPYHDGVVQIVPGLAWHQRGEADVMRGEETQVLGALSDVATATDALFVLPGTHSKWVRTSGVTLAEFVTYPTGEMYELLLTKSTLGQLHEDGGDLALHDQAGFARGLDRGFRHAGDSLGKLFGVRARALLGDIKATDVAAYLSGLLIGSELRDAFVRFVPPAKAHPPIGIIADPALAQAYAAAFALAEVACFLVRPDAAARGIAAIAGNSAGNSAGTGA